MALAEGIGGRYMSQGRNGDVVLGDDWVAPNATTEREIRGRRERRRLLPLTKSPLTRKIVTFNLIALCLLVAGILYLNSARDSLAVQRASGLMTEARLVAGAFEVQMPAGAPVNLVTGDGINVQTTLDRLTLREGTRVFVYDTGGTLAGMGQGRGDDGAAQSLAERPPGTPLTDAMTWVWDKVAGDRSDFPQRIAPLEEQAVEAARAALQSGEEQLTTLRGPEGRPVFTVATPFEQNGRTVGVIVLGSPEGELDQMVRSERERVLQMFVIATVVSVGLSMVLASTISNPLSDLAAAAEIGRDSNDGHMQASRVRIPDLTARPDEIGRLSGALRGMVAALYDRIDSNEQFAADVAHEIKNPLASLRSAVGTMRVARREDQREQLLDVIDHDVRRLDRLVSDISNASRLDSELVKEEQEPFNLLEMVGNLGQYLGEDAKGKGIDFVTDLPREPIIIHGLEARLAQVFVNLITNAISFCEQGDAIRVWVRRRSNRVLVVVEDTGTGIPEEALGKIFNRFYSQRPQDQFGNNSGLGLAISKQIVEAHGGVIWAENIRPTDADVTSEPLGARFVVGLPV
ncbi:two-component system, OmpR family, sensor histidine kinase ChvG [Salinihabitans flavidus]|uniref:histidine kinase n=1 Tax=Salinihabitans flavidus TaxID=569882 RepID=A0A1H8T7F8_9RHOB|nr:sensor histidine kinase [Salinihabitans flavidus]SEO86887.1 two-component system, OmpR family, sensor histidine kinase ChvG [Salinihabitans flavidus]